MSLQKVRGEAEQTARSVKCFLGKREDPSSILKTQVKSKKPDMVGPAYNFFNSWEVETADPWDLITSQPSLISKLQKTVRDLSQQTMRAGSMAQWVRHLLTKVREEDVVAHSCLLPAWWALPSPPFLCL